MLCKGVHVVQHAALQFQVLILQFKTNIEIQNCKSDKLKKKPSCLLRPSCCACRAKTLPWNDALQKDRLNVRNVVFIASADKSCLNAFVIPSLDCCSNHD